MRRPEDVSGDGGVSDKTGWEGGGQQLGTRIGQEKQMCAGTPERVYSVGLLRAKTEIPANVIVRHDGAPFA